MKKMFLVLLIIAIAMIGIVSAAVSTLPVGESGFYDITSSPSGAAARLMAHRSEQHQQRRPWSLALQGIQSLSIKRDLSHGVNMWCSCSRTTCCSQCSPGAIPTPTPTQTTPAPGSQKGYYKVSSDPTGGSVLFDGTNYGITPVTITVSTTGTPDHTITVSKSGHQTWTQFYSGNPSADQTISVFATLNPVVQTGNIYVNSNPSGASAILDNGYNHLTTPGTFNAVRTGWHNVQVSKSGTVSTRSILRWNQVQQVMWWQPWYRIRNTGQYQYLQVRPGPACTWIPSIRVSPTRSWATLLSVPIR